MNVWAMSNERMWNGMCAMEPDGRVGQRTVWRCWRYSQRGVLRRWLDGRDFLGRVLHRYRYCTVYQLTYRGMQLHVH